MSNPFLNEYSTKFGVVPFDLIEEGHYVEAIKKGISEHKKEIEEIKKLSDKDFGVIEKLSSSGEILNRVKSVFYNQNSSNSNDNMRDIAKEISPLVTGHANDLSLDPELFAIVKEVYDKKESLDLDKEQEVLLDKTYKSFARNGALLKDSEQARFREINNRLSDLSLEFQTNLLKDSQSYVLIVERIEDLDGLPEGAKEAAQMTAKEKGYDGKWCFTLDFPSFYPFMMYAKNRELREKLFTAYGNRSNNDNEYDNKKNVLEIVNLRHEKANLLGYSNYAQFVLEERMASKPENVYQLLGDLKEKSLPLAKELMKEVEEYAKNLDGIDELKQWDVSYYLEKLKKERFSFDQEELRPYFQLSKVIDGVFKVANKLYGLEFVVRDDLPKYHEDVITYEIKDESGEHVAIFYGDYFPREGKRSGAWMTSYREQKIVDGKDQRPHIANVCNFTKPTQTKPSLLNFNEVLTLFHEFGHALHGILSKCNYAPTSGTNVYWDFVELPSQILENWAYEKECLDLFAEHYETGEKIPEQLVEKIKNSSNFGESRATVRQLRFAYLDMAWHSTNPSEIEDVTSFERNATDHLSLLSSDSDGLSSTSFGHVFSGGYAAGYYSYKWAEVLDADAFDYFKQNGIFNRAISDKFRENILEKGGSDHPMNLYKKFRGHEPKVDALLKRGGLI